MMPMNSLLDGSFVSSPLWKQNYTSVSSLNNLDPALISYQRRTIRRQQNQLKQAQETIEMLGIKLSLALNQASINALSLENCLLRASLDKLSFEKTFELQPSKPVELRMPSRNSALMNDEVLINSPGACLCDTISPQQCPEHTISESIRATLKKTEYTWLVTSYDISVKVTEMVARFSVKTFEQCRPLYVTLTLFISKRVAWDGFSHYVYNVSSIVGLGYNLMPVHFINDSFDSSSNFSILSELSTDDAVFVGFTAIIGIVVTTIVSARARRLLFGCVAGLSFIMVLPLFGVTLCGAYILRLFIGLFGRGGNKKVKKKRVVKHSSTALEASSTNNNNIGYGENATLRPSAPAKKPTPRSATAYTSSVDPILGSNNNHLPNVHLSQAPSTGNSRTYASSQPPPPVYPPPYMQREEAYDSLI